MILFDIIVPTFARYSELHKFFEGNAELANNPSVYFWFVDDCSPTYDASVIPPWRNLSMIRLETNGGQAHARNIAIARGTARYVISLDDDAWFEQGKYALSILPDAFEKYPDAGCLMFNIATPDSSYQQFADGREIPLHITCGCAYRRETLDDIGGFSGFLHSGSEETDVSLRMIRMGWKIRQLNTVRIFHNFTHRERSLQWYYNVRYNTTRNDLLIVCMYYPFFVVPVFVAGKYLMHIRFAIRHKVSVTSAVWHTVKAFGGFLRLLPQALKRRQALSWSEFKHWRSL